MEPKQQKHYIKGKFSYKQLEKITGVSAKTIESRIKRHPERYTQTNSEDTENDSLPTADDMINQEKKKTDLCE